MIRASIAVLTLIFSTSAFSAQAVWNTAITKILTDSENFGGCMALLSSTSADNGLTCTTSGQAASGYVSMDCNGTYNSKSEGQALYSAAQLALVTQTMVTIRVTSNNLFNDKYCTAVRIDNSNVAAP